MRQLCIIKKGHKTTQIICNILKSSTAGLAFPMLQLIGIFCFIGRKYAMALNKYFWGVIETFLFLFIKFQIETFSGGRKDKKKLENRKEENLSKISVQLYITISSPENSIYLHPHREILYEGKDQIAWKQLMRAEEKHLSDMP